MKKRRLIDGLLESVPAMKSHREGKLQLRCYKLGTDRKKSGLKIRLKTSQNMPS